MKTARDDVTEHAPDERRSGLPAVLDSRTWRVSQTELERRWTLVRSHLVSHGLQALVVQGYEEKIGGGIRWLTDVPPGYPRTIIFHADDLMTMVDHGPQGMVLQLQGRDPNRPGVGELVTNWALYGGHFSSGLNAHSVIGILQRRGYKNVGLVNPRALPHGFTADIREALEGTVVFTDETDFFDHAKALKSEEELALIRGTAAIQDRVFIKLLDWIEPDMRDFEINAFIDYQLQLLGADRGIYIGKSAPIGQPATFGYRALQGRTMRRGDQINVLLESNGLGGYWTELGRLIAFGRVLPETRAAHEACVAAQALTARLLVPGADPVEVFAAYNTHMIAHGSEPERRLHSHGQGYDAVERPFIRSDETMRLEAGMNFALHPNFVTPTVFATICDNVLVGDPEGAVFLHKTAKDIFEL
jgi:Xaa-Pro aminopeptidase